MDMTGSVSTWADMTGSVNTWADRLKMLDLSERREFRDFTKVDTTLIAEVSYGEIRFSQNSYFFFRLVLVFGFAHPPPPPPPPPRPQHTHTHVHSRAHSVRQLLHTVHAAFGVSRRRARSPSTGIGTHVRLGSRIPPAALRHADPECRLGFGAFVFVCRAAAGPGRKGAGSDRRRGELAHGCARGVCACVHMYV